ncbi:TRAP transporter small permease [Croceivirga sp. JEA036]|uniref:TRAP transporter small permease n=1 Tax=Croceivirga sp. JEA036 TaxID=2721162 RepID=UPI00143B0B4E|nr:TRAP transporter small permease [Croceivirga sp. JEA036]NJB35238.1 TRAP transporter small permease [Croceivirga sp. JEA036]
MKRLLFYTRKIIKWGTVSSTFLFIVLTLVQIYGRFFLEKAPSWTEEAARVAFIYAIAFASGLAIRGNYYVDFGFLFHKLPDRWQQNLRLAIWLSVTFFFLVFTFYALEFVWMGMAETSPSLKYKMAISFSGVAIMGLSILVHLVQQHPFKNKTLTT